MNELFTNNHSLDEIGAIASQALKDRESKNVQNEIIRQARNHVKGQQIDIAISFYERINNEGFDLNKEVEELKIHQASCTLAIEITKELVTKYF